MRNMFRSIANWASMIAHIGYAIESENTLFNAARYLYIGDWSNSMEYQQQGHFSDDQDSWEYRKKLSDLLSDSYDDLLAQMSANRVAFEEKLAKTKLAKWLEYYGDIGEVSEVMDTNGNITLTPSGVLKQLKDQMDNACALCSNAATRITEARIYKRVAESNTDAAKKLYVKLTIPGNYYIQFFKDALLQSEVAWASTATSNPTSLDLTESNSSGLSGTLTSLALGSQAVSMSIVPVTVTKNTTGQIDTTVVAGPNNTGIVEVDGIVTLEMACNNPHYNETDSRCEDTISIKCTTATIGSERFSVNGKYADAENYARFDGTFRSKDLGVKFLLKRYLDCIADTGSMTISSHALTGINSTNCPDGKFYARYSSAGTYLALYSDSARSTAVAIGDCTDASGTVTLSAQNSGPSGTIRYTAKDTSGTDFEVSINAPAVDDEWSYRIYNQWDGKIQSFFCRNYMLALTSETSGVVSDPSLAPIARPCPSPS